MADVLPTSLNPSRLAAYTAAGFWGNETIYHLAARQARTTPGAFAVRDRYRRMTYAALVDAADRLAANLAGRGIRPGQRVAVWLPSRAETAIALLACSRNGYVCCPSLHRDHTVGEVIGLVERMRAAALIAQPGYGADADRRDLFAELKGHDFLRWIFRVAPAETTPIPFGEVTGPTTPAPVSSDANQVMYLPFTSGTTGEPKGVMHSDNTLLATARMMARDWALDRSVLYTLSPLSHNLGLGALITALTGGGELVVHDLPRGMSLLDRLEETGAEFLVRRADPCHRSVKRNARPRRTEVGCRPRLPHFRSCCPAAGRPRADVARGRAAKRLRHDRNLLASIYAPRRCARAHRRDLRPRLRGVRGPHLASGQSGRRGDRRAKSARSAAGCEPDARLFRRPGGH